MAVSGRIIYLVSYLAVALCIYLWFYIRIDFLRFAFRNPPNGTPLKFVDCIGLWVSHIDKYCYFPALDVLEDNCLTGGRIGHLDDGKRILVLAGMLSRLCFGVKNQFVVVRTERYLDILV